MKHGSGFFGYFMFVLFIVGLTLGVQLLMGPDKDYTRGELVTDITEGQVKEIIVYPNNENNTGYMDVELKTGEEKRLYF